MALEDYYGDFDELSVEPRRNNPAFIGDYAFIEVDAEAIRQLIPFLQKWLAEYDDMIANNTPQRRWKYVFDEKGNLHQVWYTEGSSETASE